MWSLLSQANGITDKQLLDRVNELDLRDGVADGKFTRTPVQKAEKGFAPSKLARGG